MDSGLLWGIDIQTDHSPDDLARAILAAPSIRAAVRPTPVVVVTVAPAWFEGSDAVRELERLLAHAWLDASALVLAMSERTRAHDLDTAAETMRELQEMGVRTALSNFGEGFASLRHLRTLPLEFVKVPPSFVAGACEGGEVGAMLSATLSLLSTVELEAIASGVTTKAQADALLAMRCDLGQGPGLPGTSVDALGVRPVKTPLPENLSTPEAPDPPVAIEPIEGWRAWRLVEEDGEPRLASVTRPDVWTPGEALHASCGRTGEHRPGPAEGCTCGVYAARTPEALAFSGVLGDQISVVGAISMWGTVIEHARGARSEFAYPARLRLVCCRCLRAGRGAVDPIVVVERGKEVVALCRRHSFNSAGSSVPARVVQAGLLDAYAVDLLPLERVADRLKVEVSRRRRDPRASLMRAGEWVLHAIGCAFTVAMWIWTIGGFVLVLLMFAAIVISALFGDAAPSN
jgi:EAL domain-containing protein (putative c-di-GMP-specific phosphodiesterase class I)